MHGCLHRVTFIFILFLVILSIVEQGTEDLHQGAETYNLCQLFITQVVSFQMKINDSGPAWNNECSPLEASMGRLEGYFLLIFTPSWARCSWLMWSNLTSKSRTPWAFSLNARAWHQWQETQELFSNESRAVIFLRHLQFHYVVYGTYHHPFAPSLTANW